MEYDLVITEHDDELLDQIIAYLVFHLHNSDAAAGLLSDIEAAYRRLRQSGQAFPLCNDPYLAAKGYHKYKLPKYNYVLIFIIEEHTIRIDGIFHTLENYGEKL